MENNFAGKGMCSSSLIRSQGKIEKSFSPKLTDYFIQGVRNSSPPLIKQLQPKTTPLIRPHFRSTEIVKCHEIVSLIKDQYKLLQFQIH